MAEISAPSWEYRLMISFNAAVALVVELTIAVLSAGVCWVSAKRARAEVRSVIADITISTALDPGIEKFNGNQATVAV